MVAEPVQDEQVSKVEALVWAFQRFRSLTEVVEPPTRAERVVSDVGWYTGLVIGRASKWVIHFGENLRDGFNQGRGH